MTEMQKLPENDDIRVVTSKERLANDLLGLLLARYIMPLVITIAIPLAGFALNGIYHELESGQDAIVDELKEIKETVNTLIRQNDNHEFRLRALEREDNKELRQYDGGRR